MHFEQPKFQISFLCSMCSFAHNSLSHQYRTLSSLQCLHSSKMKRKPKEWQVCSKIPKLALQAPPSSTHHAVELIYYAMLLETLWLPWWKPSLCASHWHYLNTSPWNLTCPCSQPLVTVETLHLSVELRICPLQFTQKRSICAWCLIKMICAFLVLLSARSKYSSSLQTAGNYGSIQAK